MTAPIWRIEINKSYGAESWANDYLTDDATILDAQDLSALLLTFEQQMHTTAVFFNYIRISSTAPADRYFRHIAINQPGIQAAGDSLPLYCTARLDMPTSTSDPCRKYYRLPIAEGWQTNGFIAGSVMTMWAASINTYLVTPSVLSHIVTNAGNKVISASFNPAVQMRQLHRHRRKKVPPAP